MTNALWLGEKAARRARFQFALVEFFADAMIERAAQHHHVPIIGMRMGLECSVRRPPDQLDIQSRFRAVPHDGRKFLRFDARNFGPRHLFQLYRGDGQLAARRDRKLLRQAWYRENRSEQQEERETKHESSKQ